MVGSLACFVLACLRHCHVAVLAAVTVRAPLASSAALVELLALAAVLVVSVTTRPVTNDDEHTGVAPTLKLAVALSWRCLALVSVVCGDLMTVVLLVVMMAKLPALPW